MPITTYTRVCHCGKTFTTVKKVQPNCSRTCGQRTETARERNRISGKKGGRSRARPTPTDWGKWQAYRSGFAAGKYRAWVRYRRLLDTQRASA
jgi:hypothetical protein